MTEEQAEEKVREIFKISKAEEEKSLRDSRIEMSFGKETVQIEVKQMYSYVDCSFANLKKLSELFKTDNIDLNQWSRRGCDTCDYGSVYSVEIDIKLEKSLADIEIQQEQPADDKKTE